MPEALDAPPSAGSTAGVARMCDQITEVYARLLGDTIHIGLWDGTDDHTPLREATGRLTDLVIDRTDAADGHHVLDVGCGTGVPAVQMAVRRGVRVTGITVSGHQVELANRHALEAGVADRARFERVDAMDLPYPDHRFDAAVAIESLAHMSDRARALRHVARVLRPGGRVVMTDLVVHAPVDGADRDTLSEVALLFNIPDIITEPDYRALLGGAGLDIVECTDLGEDSRRTYTLLADGLQARSRELDDHQVSGLLERMAEILRALADIPELGYALVVARRP